MGFLFGAGEATKQAKKQAKAELASANAQAANDRLVAQGAEQARETLVAQDKASRTAAELLSKPQDQVDLQLAPETPDLGTDASGRKRSTRSTYTANTPKSGIRI